MLFEDFSQNKTAYGAPRVSAPCMTPFRMQLSVLDARMEFERPWPLPPRPSATPVTSLRGTLGKTTAEVDHFRVLNELLRKTPSRYHAGQILPAITLQIERGTEANSYRLRVLFRGTQARENIGVFYDALCHAGTRGLLHAGKPLRFKVHEDRFTKTNCLDWVRRRLPTSRSPTEAVVKLKTPCHAPSFAPRDLVGNMACSLAKLEHTLQNDPSATKNDIDADADTARNVAREAFANVVEVRRQLHRGPKGERASGETGHIIPLHGVYGTITLGGDLQKTLPWLILAELHGLGRHTAFGMGQVQILLRCEEKDLHVPQPT